MSPAGCSADPDGASGGHARHWISGVDTDRPGRASVPAMERARRSCDGLSVGDAFGQCFFAEESAIHERRLPMPPWRWTDDTAMAAGIVRALTRSGRIDPDELAVIFAQDYRQHAHRGYGAGARTVLSAIAGGARWQDAAAYRTRPPPSWAAVKVCSQPTRSPLDRRPKPGGLHRGPVDRGRRAGRHGHDGRDRQRASSPWSRTFPHRGGKPGNHFLPRTMSDRVV
jgi:hypothetical protein